VLKSKLINGGVYLALSVILTILLASLWGYIAIAFYTQTGFMALLNGFILGTTYALFIGKTNRAYFIWVCTLCSIISVNLGIYIGFAYTEQNSLMMESAAHPFGTALDTLQKISLNSYESFASYLAKENSLKIWFWHLLVLLTAWQQVRSSGQIKTRIYRLKKFLLSSKN
jgi:hypothetical protein